MNIIDLLISKLRKIDKYSHFQIVDKIEGYRWKEYVASSVENEGLVIILDARGIYKDEINAMGGLYVEVQSVATHYTHIDFPDNIGEDINMEDFLVIGIGFKDNYAKNSIRKQSIGLGSCLNEFLLVDSKKINVNKYILVDNDNVLEHWGLKTRIKVMQDRNFKCVLVRA